MEIAEADASGVITIRYIPGPGVDQRVAMIRDDGAVHFYHANRLGHVIAMASSGGAWSDRYVYTPYGVQEQIAGDPATNATSSAS